MRYNLICLAKERIPIFQNPSDAELASILREAKRIAVVGLSDNPERTSYAIAKEMQRRGYQIIPVNPTVDEVLGERAYKSLAEVPGPIDIINVFRRSDALLGVVQEAVRTSAPIIWAQEGVIDEAAAELAQQNNKVMVMDICIMVMHSRLVGRHER